MPSAAGLDARGMRPQRRQSPGIPLRASPQGPTRHVRQEPIRSGQCSPRLGRSWPWPSSRPGVDRVRELTVMFTDIAGFTRLAETLPPTLVARLLRSHFRLLAQCIESEVGRIDKIMGDGLIAVWEHDSRSRAALHSRLARGGRDPGGSRGRQRSRQRRGQPPIRLRVGRACRPADRHAAWVPPVASAWPCAATR